jgi:hypothetical protein
MFLLSVLFILNHVLHFNAAVPPPLPSFCLTLSSVLLLLTLLFIYHAAPCFVSLVLSLLTLLNLVLSLSALSILLCPNYIEAWSQPWCFCLSSSALTLLSAVLSLSTAVPPPLA